MAKITTVRIYAIDWESLKKIKEKHGFANYADTLNYVLQKFPEMIVKTPDKGTAIAGNPASPVIKEQSKDFMQIGGEKL